MFFIAHRGESIDSPENTMAAFELAWERDCVGVECDIWMTKDNVLVCHHDITLKRTAGCNMDITDVTYSELLQQDVGKWQGDNWKNERIPTLKQLLDSTPTGKKLFIEIKDTKRILPQFFACIETSNVSSEQICVISFDEEVIAQCKTQMPELKACLLISFDKKSDSTVTPTAEELVAKLQALSADGVDGQAYPDLTREYINTVKTAGFEFHVWTIDEKEKASRFIELGVDSITSNKAACLQQELA